MLKIGLLGIGHLGKIHARLLREIPEFDLVGFYDHDFAKAKQYSDEHALPFFHSADNLLENVDVIDIVTPTLTHHSYAVQAARAGKHMFIEKPVTATVKEARDLQKIVAEAEVTVQVGHVERFNQAFMSVLNDIDQPMFIETHRLAQFNPRGTDVSVVLDLMIHDIDIALHVVKSTVKKIHANGVAVVSATPDIANARLEFANGAVCNLTASRISMKNMRKTRIFQNAAYISVDFLNKTSEIIHVKNAENVPYNPLAMEIDLGNGNGTKIISITKPEISEVNAIKHELTLFAHSINTNTDTAVTLDQATHVLEVANAIVEQLK